MRSRFSHAGTMFVMLHIHEGKRERGTKGEKVEAVKYDV